MILRPATADDIRSYAGSPLPEWCVRWRGAVAERDGEIVGVGLLCWDAAGNITAWVDYREQLSPFLLHREALATLAGLAMRGEQSVTVICDASKIGAAAWLERLGFKPRELTEWGQAWTCDLT